MKATLFSISANLGNCAAHAQFYHMRMTKNFVRCCQSIYVCNLRFSYTNIFMFPFLHSQDIPFRRSVECDMGYVEWGMELRTWLPGSASLITTLTQSPLWPVEVVRCTPSTQVTPSHPHTLTPSQQQYIVYIVTPPNSLHKWRNVQICCT